MPVTGTVVARNLQDGITVLSSDIKGSHTVEWGAMGDPDGNDVQYIPEEIVNSVPFKKALARGVIELMPEDMEAEVADALSLQVASFQRRKAGAREDIHNTLERPANNDSITMFCVGPDSRGNNGGCRQPVPVVEKKKDDVPPLCHTHRPLAAQFVAESGSADGKAITTWSRVTMGARESA